MKLEIVTDNFFLNVSTRPTLTQKKKQYCWSRFVFVLGGFVIDAESKTRQMFDIRQLTSESRSLHVSYQ